MLSQYDVPYEVPKSPTLIDYQNFQTVDSQTIGYSSHTNRYQLHRISNTALPAAPAAFLPAASQPQTAAPRAARTVPRSSASQPPAQMGPKAAFPALAVVTSTAAPSCHAAFGRLREETYRRLGRYATRGPIPPLGKGRQRKRHTSSTHSNPSDLDAFLNLRISKLRHHNVAFLNPDDVYDFVCPIHTCLQPLHVGICTLRKALPLSTGDQCLLHLPLRPNERNLPPPRGKTMDIAHPSIRHPHSGQPLRLFKQPLHRPPTPPTPRRTLERPWSLQVNKPPPTFGRRLRSPPTSTD